MKISKFKNLLKIENSSFKSLFTIVFFLLIGIITLIRIGQKPVPAAAGWWSDSWNYRRIITISNSSGSIQTNIVPGVTIDTASLISSGKMKTNCDDIRITDSTSKVLPHFVTQCNSSATNIYFQIPSLPTSSATFYVYYGNPSASNIETSSIFTYFEGFENNSAANWSTTTVSVGITNSNVNKGSYDLKFMAQGTSWDSVYQTFTNVNNWSNQYLDYEILSDANVTWYTDPRDIGSSRMNAWISNSLAANTWTTVSGNLSTNPIAPNIKSIQYFTNNDDINRNIYIDNFRVRKFISSVSSSANSEEQSQSPLVYLKFDDGAGTKANDSSGNNLNATLSASSWQDGVSGKAFNGSNGANAYIPDNSKIDISDNLTISFWYYPRSYHTNYANHPISKSNSTNDANFVFYEFGDYSGSSDTHGMYRWYANAGGVWKEISSTWTLPQLNQWYYITFTYNSVTGGQMYVNGQAVGSPVGSGTLAVNTANLQILGDTSTSKPSIDEFKIYNYVRNLSQIKSDFNLSANRIGGAAVSSGTTNSIDLKNGLLGYWKIDQAAINGTAGEIKDSSGFGNTGTGYSGVTAAAGKYGNSAAFPGSNGYVKINMNTARPSSSVSFGAWIKWYAFTTEVGNPNLGLIDYSPNTGSVFSLSENPLNHPNQVGASINTINGQKTVISGALSTGTWYHVFVTYDGTQLKLFINGSPVSTTSLSGVLNWSGALDELYLAAPDTLSGYNENFVGNIDEVRVYNRGLSDTEVAELYNHGPSPAAYWNFDENSGTTVNDTSGYSLSGSFSGSGTSRWSTGKYNAAGSFNGSDDRVLIPDSDYLTGSQITLEGWIKWDGQRYASATSQDWAAIISKGRWDSGEYTILMSRDSSTPANTSFNFYINNASRTSFSLGSSLDTAWHHIAAVYDGTVAYLYLDGSLKSSAAVSLTVANTANQLAIGGQSAGANNYNWGGLIDDIKIYNYARSGSEILTDMSSPVQTVTTKDQPAFWKFDEGYGSTVNNSGSQKNILNGTLSGSYAWTNNGKSGKALLFDGVSGQVSVANQPSINPTSISISMWLYLNANLNCDTNNNWRSILHKGSTSGTATGYDIVLEESGAIAWDTGSSNPDRWWPSGLIIPQNTWTHLILTYDESGLKKAYLNGRLIGTKSVTPGPLSANTSNLLINNASVTCPNGSGNFPGLIDDVRIYNIALADNDVKLDYNRNTIMIMGSSGTDTSGKQDSSSNRSYCISGDTSACNPPVGEWKFEEGVGTTAFDSSGNGLNGSLINSPSWATGKFGKAISLSESQSQYISTAAGLNQSFNSAFTAEAWIKKSAAGTGYDWIISKGNDFGLTLNSGSVTQLRVFKDSGAIYADSNTFAGIADNKWHQVAVTFDNPTNTLQFYVDGQSVGVGSSASFNFNPLNTSSSSYFIGAWVGPNHFFNGQIDQVQIYDYARTPAQIVWDYNRGGPVGWWKFDECQGGVANDSSGNSKNGNISIGVSGLQNSLGTCSVGSSAAWTNGAGGKINSSLSFDGTDDWVTVGSGPYSNFGVSDFTVSAWLKTNSSATQRCAASTASGPAGWRFGSQSGYPYFLYGDGTHYHEGPVGNKLINDNKWHLVTIVYLYANMVQAYVDGVYTGNVSVADVTGSATTNSSLWIGSMGGGTNGVFPGQIDDLRVYNYALTPAQIKTIYNNGAVSFN